MQPEKALSRLAAPLPVRTESLREIIRVLMKYNVAMSKLCYISGKISGLLHIEYCANFDYAAIEAEKLGYIPVNPIRIYDGKNWCWFRFMVADLVLLARCEAIYLQKNWRESRGARIERAFARMLRKEIVYQ
jgi:hypothetical protein